MTARPVDAGGDILPVLSAGDLLSGAAAAAAGLSDHLRLFSGDWWEYAERGNELPELLGTCRRTGADAQTLAAYLSGCVLRFPGVRNVSGARAEFSGAVFRFSCTAELSDGGTVPVRLVTA